MFFKKINGMSHLFCNFAYYNPLNRYDFILMYGMLINNQNLYLQGIKNGITA